MSRRNISTIKDEGYWLVFFFFSNKVYEAYLGRVCGSDIQPLFPRGRRS